MAGNQRDRDDPPTSARPPDPLHPRETQQKHPYRGKHRAPPSKSRALKGNLADLLLDQPASAHRQRPDTPPCPPTDVPRDRQPADGDPDPRDRQPADGDPDPRDDRDDRDDRD